MKNEKYLENLETQHNHQTFDKYLIEESFDALQNNTTNQGQRRLYKNDSHIIHKQSEHLEGQIEVNDWNWTGNVEEYDEDYYNRPRESLGYKSCDLPGVEKSICMPKDDLQNITEFCYGSNYPTICVPVKHFLWDDWTIREKDFVIEE